MNVDVLLVLAVLGGIGAVATYAAAALRGIRIWVRRTAGTTAATEEQLRTADGVPVAVHVERTAAALDRINARLDEQGAAVRNAHETAQSALTLANAVGRRLDEHLVRDHGDPSPPAQE